jgi:hypothetical protein
MALALISACSVKRFLLCLSVATLLHSDIKRHSFYPGHPRTDGLQNLMIGFKHLERWMGDRDPNLQWLTILMIQNQLLQLICG